MSKKEYIFGQFTIYALIILLSSRFSRRQMHATRLVFSLRRAIEKLEFYVPGAIKRVSGTFRTLHITYKDISLLVTTPF
jgi:hypothetical protein